MVNLNAYDNRSFRETIGASRLKQALWYFINIILFKSGFFPYYRMKVSVLRLFGATIGSKVVIKPGVSIKFPWKLAIGNHCWLGEHVWMDNLDTIEIGNHVVISQGALLLCGNHNYKKTGFDLAVKPIRLEDGVWIGARAVVCPGVVCRSHAVLSVNSVATAELQAYGIYQGNPAVLIRERVIEEAIEVSTQISQNPQSA